MKKVGVYFKNNHYEEDFKYEKENVSYRNDKLEVMEVELLVFEDGYLKITYKTNEYVGGENTYKLNMKYIDRYYIF